MSETKSSTSVTDTLRLGDQRLNDPALAVLETRYETATLIGSGGMGKVYRARDRETRELVAIKILRPEVAADPAMAERFKNELRLSRRITHKNVCRIYDFNRIGDVSFITMEYVDGESLRARLRRQAPLALDMARTLMLQIAAGLKEAHAQGVIHRDLKPENIMVDRDGAKIMDFGIARSLTAQATTTSAFLGTPAYIAPEQAQGKSVDQRADIYALGLIFYECLTGRAAFTGDTPIEVALKQVNERPLAPRRIVAAVPAHVEAIIMRCLEKDPNRRYASVDEFCRALTADAVVTPRPVATQQANPSAPRSVWPWAGIAVVVAIGMWLWPRDDMRNMPSPEPTVPIGTAPVRAHTTPTPTIAPPAVVEAPTAAATTAPPAKPERAALHEQLLAAAEAGEPQAQYRLALALAAGPAAIRNDIKSAQWMQRAAEANHADAQFALGKMYERGRGVPQDMLTARRWYERAAAAGHVQARAALERPATRPRTRP